MLPRVVSSFFLSNRFTRESYRKAGKKWRQFKRAREELSGKSLSTKASSFFISFIKFLVALPSIERLIRSNSKIAKITYDSLIQLGWKFKNRNLIIYLAGISYFRHDFRNAFELYFYLIQSHEPNISWINRAAASEAKLDHEKFYQYFKKSKDELPEKIYYNLTCFYSQKYEEIIPEWQEILVFMEKDFDLPLVNRFLTASLAYQKLDHIKFIEERIFSNYVNKNARDKVLERFRKTLTIIAACYYRSGNIQALLDLNLKISYPNLDWQLYKAFGESELMKAMEIRGRSIDKSFKSGLPSEKSNRFPTALTPEKDLCGEVFNALFYTSIIEKNPTPPVIVCDSRLLSILKYNFEGIRFVPKTPRYLQQSKPEKFDKIPPYLRNYLDNSSYKKVKEHHFLPIDYQLHFFAEPTQAQRSSGWLSPPIKKLEEINAIYHQTNNRLIGIASHSTIRSKLRDIHMISLDEWGPIFSLPNTKFINLNASLNKEECEKIAKKHNIELIQPEFDLYNDFESLLALMSILDYAIVPANNLMDFAASVGTKTIVFSPTNIMKTWRYNHTNEYVFSKNVEFVFPKEIQESTSTFEMVKSAALKIQG